MEWYLKFSGLVYEADHTCFKLTKQTPYLLSTDFLPALITGPLHLHQHSLRLGTHMTFLLLTQQHLFPCIINVLHMSSTSPPDCRMYPSGVFCEPVSNVAWLCYGNVNITLEMSATPRRSSWTKWWNLLCFLLWGECSTTSSSNPTSGCTLAGSQEKLLLTFTWVFIMN